MNILLIGGCGSGKTWVAQQLLTKQHRMYQYGLMRFKADDRLAVAGVYDGGMFQGSDRLSMAVSREFQRFHELCQSHGWHLFMEGDRFTNKACIRHLDPYVIRILDDGSVGRTLRGSDQSPQHIQRIATRVRNFDVDLDVKDSNEALLAVQSILK